MQRPLWASTSVKDPSSASTMYLVELAAPDTVNTMPEATLHATQAHGTLRGDTIRGTYDESRKVFEQLEGPGHRRRRRGDVLEQQGVQKFEIVERAARDDQDRDAGRARPASEPGEARRRRTA